MAGSKSQRVPRVSLSDVVYERLRDEIIHGDIEDESRLSQVELAERYGVSRIPIREALRRLQAESLVVATPYHPFVVRNVTPEQVVELVDIRAALEDLSLSRREKLSEAEIAALRKINKQMASKNGRGDAWFELDRELHRVMAGSNTMTVEMIDEVRDRVHRYVSTRVSAKPGRTAATEEHAGIIDALESGDMKLARKRLHDHIMHSRASIVGRLRTKA